MFSNSIREHSIRSRGLKPSIIFRSQTQLGIFSMTAIEATVTKTLEPFEWVVLSIGKTFKKFTRIEIHAITGFMLNLVEDVIHTLLQTNLIRRVEFDREQLEANIERIERDIGSSWETEETKRILRRKLINQYEVTNAGEVALREEKRTTQDVVDLNLVISANPFKVFFDEIQLKQVSLDELDVTPDIIERVFYLARKEGESLDNKIIPVAVGGDSVVEAHEVVTAHIWIPVEADKTTKPALINNDRFDLYITSTAFLRWSNPETTKNLSDYIEVDQEMLSTVITVMSNSFDIIEEVIEGNLSLQKDRVTWLLKCDLEILYLVREAVREPIEQTIAELFLEYDEDWEVGFLLKLLPTDDLSAQALFGARFHSKVNRTGFTYAEGREVWEEMLKDAGVKEYVKNYDDTLEILVESAALKKVNPKVNTIVVDLNSVLARNQKRSLFWKFSRIKELENFFEKADIDTVYYYGTEKLLAKIDDLDSFNTWIESVNFEFYDTYDEDEVSPAMRFAASNGYHYIGDHVPPLKSDEEIRKLRVERREINYSFKNRLKILDLEPMYYWYPSNLVEYLYNQYYE